VAGGLKVDDPALDLAIVTSLVSSYEDIPVPSNVCFAAEVGLGGEVRAVNRIESRIAEAQKLGFETIYISKYNTKGLDINEYKIQVRPVARLDELFVELLR
jgi:DNA repair protein RadA/Sms